MPEARMNWVFRCVMTDLSGEEHTTRTAAIVTPVVFEIITEPADAEGQAGDAFIFTVEATGVATYQWQFSTNNGSTWTNTNWTGAKTATLVTPAMPEARMNWVFRCVMTGVDGEEHTTRTAAIVTPVVFEIITEPADAEGQAGDAFIFTVEATGVATYQWQFSTNNGDTWTNTNWTGAKTATLVTPAMPEARMNWVFRCVMTDLGGEEHTTRTAAIIRQAIIVDGIVYTITGENTVKVSSYQDTIGSTVVIPTEVNGYRVTEIGANAFEGNTTLQSISLPNAITVIGKRAFAECTSLREMTCHD